ncbi:(2,3-dihydroxybenzoyl)adenylate synthase [Streptomyces flaveolus]|uniref:2-hydroxy-7-methoxy-5-methyl-1-naphthoate--CoA ligase n=2 Tax=Streptomyces TaxID=1883 RepID=NCSB2_STRCZ|nr:RecName: Full=2-hydroxy-7-methoxy-5-methyl-1-naphthoate--CoA ligase; AltName: Full=Neocarzinostatin biosynthesis protein B2 [Streptomyces carzinostaticus]AAM77987.1 adenylate ligase [Streptomyces carzinostaticus subsp. neocarzinostaticus]
MHETAAAPAPAGFVPWPDDVAARYTAAGHWEGRSLGTHLAEAARKVPEAVCLVDGPVRMSYSELMARADGAAVRMRGLGIRPADRVVVQLPNCWEHVVVTMACLRLGALPIWALPQYRHRELSGVVTHARASALVVPDVYREFDHQALAHEVAEAQPTVRHVLVAGSDVRPDSVDLRALCEPLDADEAARVAAELDRSAPRGEEVAMLKLSGGTTGLPKLVARTHNDLSYMIKRAAQVCGFGRDTVYLAVLPLGHGFPNTGPGVLGTLLAGGRVVISGSPAPEAAFALMERERVTATSVVPAIVMRWLQYRDERPGADLGSLELMQVGASRLEPEVARQVGPKLGCRLQQVFGMAEGLLCLTRLDDPDDVVHYTQGRPISPDDEIRVVDPEGRTVGVGEPGALLTRGPYTPRGYYDSPSANARAFTPDGWYRTGDLVRRTPDGNLIVVGREKDLINRGGEKINAEEVEGFAVQVDGVLQAAAVGLPDSELGERICLFVVLADGTRVELADVRKVMENAETASFKLPERLITLPSLPTTPMGKIDKKALRAAAGRMSET